MRTDRGGWISNLGIFAKIADAIGTSLIGYIVFLLYVPEKDFVGDYFLLLSINFLLVLLIFPKFGIYHSWRGRSRAERLLKILNAWSICVGIILLYMFLIKGSAVVSRAWYFSWIVTSFFYLNAYRVLVDIFLHYVRKKRLNLKRIVIYGAGAVGKSLIRKLDEQPELGFCVVAFIDDNESLIGKSVNGIFVQGVGSLEAAMSEADELWFALPLRAHDRIQNALYRLRHSTGIIRYVPDIYSFRLLNQRAVEIAGVPVIEINGQAMSLVDRFVKRLFDIVFSLAAILCLSPVLALVALLIRLDSKGPVIYRQKRHGAGGKPIEVFKFRSMYAEHGDVFQQARAGDRRITKIGAILRKTSLDELPQFFNVLGGSMSVVGPRPHAVVMNLEYQDKIDMYMQRHKVKPGITGWAQVNGFRGETDTIEKMEKRVECDLYYIENWSFLFDLKIVILTVFKGIVHENAY